MPRPLTSQVGCLSWCNTERVLHLQGHLTMAENHPVAMQWGILADRFPLLGCEPFLLLFPSWLPCVTCTWYTSTCRTSRTSWKQCSPQRGGTRILSLSWFNSLWCGHWNALSSLVWSYFGSFPFLPALGENSCSWETDISVDQDTCTI